MDGAYAAHLLQCTAEQVELEAQLHRLARHEVALLQERQQHEEDYRKQEAGEAVAALRRDLCEASLHNEQLKLEVLRWRKQCSLMRLKLASARENVQLHERNLDVLAARERRLSSDVAALRRQLADGARQLTDVAAAKARAQAEAAKFQSQAVQAEVQLTRLTEEVKLANGRCTTAAGQAAELVHQLAAVQAENASLQKQLAEVQGRDNEAAAAHERLQSSLNELQRQLRDSQARLAELDSERMAAKLEAVKASGMAEAASARADAVATLLAEKQKQLEEWHRVDQAKQAAAAQQMQLSQVSLEQLRGHASAQEARLLEELDRVRQQLAQEKAARAATEAGSAAAGKAVTDATTAELRQLKQQLAATAKQLAAADARADREAERAAALMAELEQQQEQQTLAAVHTVDAIVMGLPDAKAPGKAGGGGGGRARRAAATTASARVQAQAAWEADEGEAREEQDAQAPQEHQQEQKQRRRRQPKQKRQLLESDGGSGDEAGELQEPPALPSPPPPQQQQQQPDEDGEGAHGSGGEASKPEGDAPPSGQDDARAAQTGYQTAAPAPPPPPAPARGKVLQAIDANTQSLAGPSFGADGSRKSVNGTKSGKPAAAGGAAVEQAQHRAGGPPPLGFAPQSARPGAALHKQASIAEAAAQERVMPAASAANMIKMLSTFKPQEAQAGKPGARKRKFGPLLAASNTMDTLPPDLLLPSSFQPPKVRKPGM